MDLIGFFATDGAGADFGFGESFLYEDDIFARDLGKGKMKIIQDRSFTQSKREDTKS